MTKPGYDLAIHGLLRKRSELMRELEIKRDELAAVQNDIAAVERALGLIGHDGKLEQSRKRVLKDIRRELRRFILDELRKGGALSSRDLAVRLAAVEGKNPEDKKAVQDIVARVSKAITALLDKQVVERVKGADLKAYRYQIANTGST